MRLSQRFIFSAGLALTRFVVVRALSDSEHEEQVLKPRMIQLTEDKHMYWNPEADENEKDDDDDINYFSPGYYPSRLF